MQNIVGLMSMLTASKHLLTTHTIFLPHLAGGVYEGHNNSSLISHFHFLHNTSVFVRRKSIRSNGCRLLLLCPSLLSLYIQTGKMQRRPHHKKGEDSIEEQLDLRTKVHTKRYLCEQCGKMFKTLSLKVHQRLHTG